MSHKSDWKNGYRFGIEANTPFQVVTGIEPTQKASLPEQKSFFGVSAENVIVSAIKKCDDDNSVVVRLYDIEGRDSDVTLDTFFPMAAAEHTNIIEADSQTMAVSGNSLKTKIGHHAIETYKLMPDSMK